MSFIQDIQNSHKLVKSFLYSLILLPFWYVNIYFFHYEFYQANEFILIVALCICLHITSLILFALGPFVLSFPEENPSVEDKFSMMSVGLILWFIIIDGVALTIKFFNGSVMYFYTFLCVFFGPLILAGLFHTVFGFFKYKKGQKSKT